MCLVTIWSGPPLRTTTLHLGDNCIGFLDVSLYRYSDTSRYSDTFPAEHADSAAQRDTSDTSDTSRYSDTAIKSDTSYLMYRPPSGSLLCKKLAVRSRRFKRARPARALPKPSAGSRPFPWYRTRVLLVLVHSAQHVDVTLFTVKRWQNTVSHNIIYIP